MITKNYIKQILLIIIFICSIATAKSAPTVNVTLAWDDPDTNIAEYIIYYRNLPSTVVQKTTSKTLSVTLALVPNQPYQASVTAVTTANQSSPSSPVLSFTSPTAPISSPVNLRVSPTATPTVAPSSH